LVLDSVISTPQWIRERNGIEEGGGRALAETLCLNTTLTSLNLYYNGLGGGRAVAETLRLNTTLASLNLD
jgi:hypothetical protein